MESAGNLLTNIAGNLSYIIQLFFDIVISILVLFLLLRWVLDLFGTNPFGRIVFYVRRLTNDLVFYARSSRLYIPLKRALGFDPAILMVLLALALVWFLVPGFLGSIPMVLSGIGKSLIQFGLGNISNGVSALIGSVLLAVLFFLMLLMTIIFVNWVCGALNHTAYWAHERLAPLLRTFEFGGAMAGWSFPLLWLVLYLATIVVRSAFFKV